jgi:hypothetical protein
MKRMWFVVVIALAFGAPEGAAQDIPAMNGRAGERLETWRKVRIQEALKLDEEHSVRFFARYNKHIQTMREINQQRNALIDELAAMDRSGATDADREKVIDRLSHFEEEITHAKVGFLTEARGVLSPRQLALYIVFERDFNKNMREIIRQNAQERLEKRNAR